MPGFKADDKSIGKFGEEMGGLVDDADTAKAYVDTWLDLGFSEARIFATIANTAADVKAALAENYTRLATVQKTAAGELGKAAAMYRKTDDERAEALDKTYPAGK